MKKHGKLYEYLMIVIGTGVLAFGIACFYDPIGLVTGGFTGLAIVIKSVTGAFFEGGVPLWVTNLVLNVPMFILAYFLKGPKFIGKSFFGAIMLSVWLAIIPQMNFAGDDMLLSAIFGGVFSGAGMGLVFRTGTTTGGTDLVSALIQLKIRHVSIVQILQIIDAMVILLGMFVFGVQPTMYAIIAIVVTTNISDMVLEGTNYSKAAYIITNEYEQVANRIMKELDRGVTGLHAKGMYTSEEKCMLYCIVSQKEIVVLKDIVNEIDPKAFVIVSEVREVLGEGFQEYKKEF
ncbi:MAG: YitT family protein [Agathobacter sp.]|nr:YitT family protein [Agathobacter sp.]